MPLRRLLLLLAVGLAGCASSSRVDLAFPTAAASRVQLVDSNRLVVGSFLYAPPGPGPFPAVVLSHTCGGLRRHVFEWAERLVAAGYVALVIDHLGPRSLTNNCPPDNAVSANEFAEDAAAALEHLRGRSLVDPGRVAHMGFSYGAMAGVRLASRTFQRLWLGGRRFQAVIAFYPWCGEYGPGPERNLYPDIETPLLLILGADDDETPPGVCVEAASRIAERGRPIAWKVYPGTTHSFDSSIMGDRSFTRPLPGGRTTTYRYNRQSTEDAWRESREFLARHLKGGAPER